MIAGFGSCRHDCRQGVVKLLLAAVMLALVTGCVPFVPFIQAV